MTSYMLQGSSSRATKSTRMNNQSSRSLAIFTIYMEEKKIISCMKSEDIDIMQTKFHLVDLAGSECVKRSGVYGERLKEATSINSGLLVLGKVIDALCKKAQGKKVLHIPYHESKLIYLLKDSLGGSSRTVMSACVSPTNTNINETLSTLDHAYRARSIQNKAIDKDRKIKDLEEKVKKMEELVTRMHPREEIQGPWSTRISNTEDFISRTPPDSTPCPCTRFSSCRTTRCECHTLGRKCGEACKCRPWRCDMKSSNTTTIKSRCGVGASGISQG